MKTVFNYRLQNRTGTCSRNTPRSSLAGRGDTPWVPIVGAYQLLCRQSCLLKPKQTNQSGRPCVCASARVIPVRYPGVKSLCLTSQPKSKSALCHNPVRVCPSTLSVSSVSYTTPTYPVCPTSLCPLSCAQHHRRSRGATHATVPGAVCPTPQGYPCSALCHTPVLAGVHPAHGGRKHSTPFKGPRSHSEGLRGLPGTKTLCKAC